MPVTPSIGLVTSAPDRRILYDNRWLSGHRRLRGAQGHDLPASTPHAVTRAIRYAHTRVLALRRAPHIPTSGAPKAALLLNVLCGLCTRAVRAGVYCARCANRAMLRSKVIGRAGGRRGYQRRSHDGRAQPRAVWAMPRPVERAPARIGRCRRSGEARSLLSFPSMFVTGGVATSRGRLNVT